MEERIFKLHQRFNIQQQVGARDVSIDVYKRQVHKYVIAMLFTELFGNSSYLENAKMLYKRLLNSSIDK